MGTAWWISLWRTLQGGQALGGNRLFGIFGWQRPFPLLIVVGYEIRACTSGGPGGHPFGRSGSRWCRISCYNSDFPLRCCIDSVISSVSESLLKWCSDDHSVGLARDRLVPFLCKLMLLNEFILASNPCCMLILRWCPLGFSTSTQNPWFLYCTNSTCGNLFEVRWCQWWYYLKYISIIC